MGDPIETVTFPKLPDVLLGVGEVRPILPKSHGGKQAFSLSCFIGNSLVVRSDRFHDVLY
jgi:hypothetical protein